MWPGGPLGLYSHAESRGRRSRVSRRRSGVRADRLPRGRAELRSLAAHADREVGRTLAAAFAIAHEALDDPILERMEADHREPATGPQHRERGRQRGLEGAELVVDGNPERLEHALGGMTVSKAGRSRNRRLDRLDEVARPLERILLPAPDDRLRDLPRVPLLAVTLENGREVPFRGLVDDSRGAHLGGGIHTHVEWRVSRVREAAFGTIDLHR